LAAFKVIIKEAKKYLKKNPKFEEFNIPQVILEIGKGQENEVKQLFLESNLKDIKVFPDLRGINRWICASC